MWARNFAALLAAVAYVVALPAHGNSTDLVTDHVFVKVVVEGPECGCTKSAAGQDFETKLIDAGTNTGNGGPDSDHIYKSPVNRLAPGVHWDCDTKPATNLIPIEAGKGSELYYGITDPKEAGHWAWLTYYFNHPSVNLDQCDHIKSIEYRDGVLIITFSSQEAYDYAVDTWLADDDLILVGFIPGCGGYDENDRCYFKVRDLKYEEKKLRVIAYGKAYSAEELIRGGETEWGWWAPRHGLDDDENDGSTQNGGGGGSGGNDGGSGSDDNVTTFGAKRPPCHPPADDVYGLPSACLGDFFDYDLDEDLGAELLSQNFQSFLKNIAPSFADEAQNKLRVKHRRSIHPRDPGFLDDTLDFFGDVADGVGDVLGDVGEALGDAASEVGDFIGEVASDAYETFKEAVSISGSINQEFTWKLPDPGSDNPDASDLKDKSLKQVESPWGDAILLKAFGTPPEDEEEEGSGGGDEKSGEDEGGFSGSLRIYCVGCGVTGTARIEGRAAFSLVEGITEGVIELSADVNFVFKLGIEAQLVYKKEFENELLNIGLPGLSYGVVTIGPSISLASKVEFEAAAKGQILAGAEMGLVNAVAKMDFVNPGKSDATGWTPYFKPVFEASGEIVLSASLALPVGIECGITIAGFKAAIGLYDEPTLKAKAKYDVSFDINDGKDEDKDGEDEEKSEDDTSGTSLSTRADGDEEEGEEEEEDDDCEGISLSLTWRNRVYIGITGLDDIDLFDTDDVELAGTAPANEDDNNETETTADATAEPTADPTGEQNSDGATTPTGDAGDPDGATATPTAGGTPGGNPDPTATGTDGQSDPTGNPASDKTADGTATGTDGATDPTDDPDAGETATGTDGASDPTDNPASDKTDGQTATGTDGTTSPTGSTDGGTENQGPISDITDLVAGSSAKSKLTYTTKPLANTAYNETDGVQFSLLVDPDATTYIVSCGNGNVYAFWIEGEDNPYCSELWATKSDVLITDGAQRVAHYYNNTMSTLGVSRLRVEDVSEIPDSGVVVAWGAYDGSDFEGGEEYLYLAVDPNDDVYYPIVCDFEDGSGSKIFLASDPEEGPKLLQSEDLIYTVTGGKVTECFAIWLLQGVYADDTTDTKGTDS
ncbi:hypothetical protein G7Z17_g715 [Cylindrodendrum hubeiense]|uniref:Uncharacterized protein n=1 Tax=Cylindrodendrum hubeiense TaxID=595255 RepID=A0A9P5LD55_9HYPO|nr:hypothetical protein G7Z17_g715 [Cylindrodendrum hubeiense]